MQDRSNFKALVIEHWVLFGLVGLNVAVFLVEFLLPADATTGLRCVPTQLIASWDNLLESNSPATDIKSLSTLLTYAFLHADIEHLLFNLLYLWIFGYVVGELIGQWWVLVVYVVTAIGGSICYVVFNSDSAVPMLGASGAVLGFQGAYLGLVVRCSLPDPFVWPIARPVSPMTLGLFAAIGFFLDLTGTVNPGGSNTGFATHLGGFATGIFFTSFVTLPGRPS